MRSAVATSGLGDPVVYWIDDHDEIVGVNDAWNRFAKENGAPDLLRVNVMHRSMWSFVADPTTRQLYQSMLFKVRHGATIGFNIRCDSPHLRRHVRITMCPAPDGGVRFESVVVAAEPRPEVRLWRWDEPRIAKLVRACGWCKRLHVDSEWREVEDAIQRLGIFEDQQVPLLTHGVCDACAAEVEGVIRRSSPSPV